ncbi:hypothetical protein DT73_00580 [Mangrovibacter sp. MFB070]|uniref:hypothetical protein n=1 Tax=Mangrovibacter sp. MFB070 TaxID=1224318 RepID=UPI0004DACA99|nr:hypothetical protein [Mangrovibacter sp. MFB070]KEA54402.1 hypothetical protein DT73_00580 [Mangrovibacter sp. MFB070]
MANLEEVTVKAILTDKIKQQIDDGSLKIDGLQLRDSRGKFTTPLDTLMVKEDQKYSPALMVQFQNEFLVTLSVINRDIRAGFREQSDKLSRIERKLDQLIKNEMDKLNAEVNFFFSEVADLDKHDSGRAERLLFDGSKTAALLAQKLGQFMDEYVDSMALRNQYNDSDALTYGESKERETAKHNRYTSDIAVYPCFKGSTAEVYTQAFLEMLNSLNILSWIHRDRNLPDYLINLETLKNKLVGLLKALAVDDLQKHFGKKYPGFRDMCYQLCPDYQDNNRLKYRGNPEAGRLSIFFNEFSSDKLAIRERIQDNSSVYQDEHLHSAITEILNMLESIDNLKTRASTLPDTTEERSQAISVLSDKFYLAHKDLGSSKPDSI